MKHEREPTKEKLCKEEQGIRWRDPIKKPKYSITLSTWEKLDIKRETRAEKEKVRSKVTLRKAEVGLKEREELNKKRWGLRLV